MTLTRSTARDLIRNSINEGSQKFFKDAEINDWIGIYYKKVTNAIAEVFEGFFGETSYTSLVANQDRYALPSNFKKLVEVRLKYESTWRKAQRLGKHEFDINREYSSAAPVYAVFGDEITIKPTPTAAVTAGLEIDHIKEPTEISSDTDTWVIPTPYHYLVVYGALSEILVKDNELNKGSYYDLKFQNGVQNMVEQLGSRDDSPKHVTIDEDGEDFFVG